MSRPAYIYRPGDGLTYAWNGGSHIWITEEGSLHPVIWIDAPKTRTATALIATVDEWRSKYGPR